MVAVVWGLPAQQAPSPAGLTLTQAVEGALRNYPSVRISQEQINAAAAGIQLARTAYLPRIDMLAQANRATRNNVFGLLLPQGTIPSMSGPALGTNNFGTAWGSAIGALVTWEPFDFGLRKAGVAAATAARTQQEAALKRTQFEVAVAAADAYVTLIAAQETVRAAQAGVDRAEVISRTTGALVNSQLRPGRMRRGPKQSWRLRGRNCFKPSRRWTSPVQTSRSSLAWNRRKSRSPHPSCFNYRRNRPWCRWTRPPIRSHSSRMP